MMILAAIGWFVLIIILVSLLIVEFGADDEGVKIFGRWQIKRYARQTQNKETS